MCASALVNKIKIFKHIWLEIDPQMSSEVPQPLKRCSEHISLLLRLNDETKRLTPSMTFYQAGPSHKAQKKRQNI